MSEAETLRRMAAELRRLARLTADESDAFVHVLHAIELEAKADEIEAGGPPIAKQAATRIEDGNPE